MKPPIDFYFDFTSPYAYIASEWIDALAARHGRTVGRHAILLGAAFQAAGVTSPLDTPVKRDYSLRDIRRSARFEGLPYRQPERFPFSSLQAARVFWWLHDSPGHGPDAAAAWADDRAKTSSCRVGSATAPLENSRVGYSASRSTACGRTRKRTSRGTGPPSVLRMMS